MKRSTATRAALVFLSTPVVATAGSAVPRIGAFGLDLAGRDLDVRPQDDFFRYANGTWLDEFQIPPDLPGFGSFFDLWIQSEEQVQAIIEDVAGGNPPAGTNERKIADLYNDFLNVDAIEAKGLSPIESDMAAIRAAKTHEDVARLLGTYARFGLNTPFGYYVDQDSKSPDHYIAYFTQGGLGLPDRDYYLNADNPRFAAAVSARRTYLTTVLGFVGHDDPAAGAEHVLALEKKLATAHWPSEETRDVDATYNKLSPSELAALAPAFDWDTYLTALELASQDAYIITTPSAYSGMAQVVANTPVEHWHAYLLCTLIGSHAAWLPKEVDDTVFTFVSQAITGATEQRERTKRAVQFVNGSMGRAVGKLYVERHFPPESKAQVDALVDNLLAAMGQRIDKLDWMGSGTKERAKEKLARFGVKIGYPDKWRDYSELTVVPGDLVGNARRATLFEYERNRRKLGREVDRSEWLMSPQVVNAYYNPQMNEIVFPAAILRPPFFDPEADPAINYGGIGAVIGHEIGHGFDDQGRKFDGHGVQQDWWTEADAKRFDERAQALVAQYDAFSPIEGMHVNGDLTLGENIGDLGGLEIAYHAYRLSLNGKEPPVIDGLTGDQRFFMGYAQIWRGKLREALMATMLASNPHSPEEFRVNGAVPNVDAWYDAFGVTEADAMYRAPEDRVRIW